MNDMIGTVATWTKRGFGWIKADEGAEYWCHIKSCRGPDDEQLEIMRPGDRVSFAVGTSPKGPLAVRVQLLTEENAK